MMDPTPSLIAICLIFDTTLFDLSCWHLFALLILPRVVYMFGMICIVILSLPPIYSWSCRIVCCLLFSDTSLSLVLFWCQIIDLRCIIVVYCTLSLLFGLMWWKVVRYIVIISCQSLSWRYISFNDSLIFDKLNQQRWLRPSSIGGRIQLTTREILLLYISSQLSIINNYIHCMK